MTLNCLSNGIDAWVFERDAGTRPESAQASFLDEFQKIRCVSRGVLARLWRLHNRGLAAVLIRFRLYEFAIPTAKSNNMGDFMALPNCGQGG